ncbi:MAG: hypothetical protein ACOYLN_07440, partial [Blastocatellia bacterium]
FASELVAIRVVTTLNLKAFLSCRLLARRNQKFQGSRTLPHPSRPLAPTQVGSLQAKPGNFRLFQRQFLQFQAIFCQILSIIRQLR